MELGNIVVQRAMDACKVTELQEIVAEERKLSRSRALLYWFCVAKPVVTPFVVHHVWDERSLHVSREIVFSASYKVTAIL